MTKKAFEEIEAFMLRCMADSAHDREHVYRVLYLALDIAETEPGTDPDVLMAACLLHDVSRPEQRADPRVDHAEAGAAKAYSFLSDLGYSPEFCARVAACIRSHRFRKSLPPETPEARILFDADKLDVCGAVGIARTLQYGGSMGAPLYLRKENGEIDEEPEAESLQSPGSNASFFWEYHFKLERLYNRFFTARGAQLAAKRKKAAECFYESLLSEVREADETGRSRIRHLPD